MLANTSECLLPSPWHCSLARKVSVSSLVVSGVGAGQGLWTLSLGKEKRWERETLTRAHPQLFPHTPRYGSSRGQRKVWEKRICVHSFRAWSALGGSWAEPPHTTVPSGCLLTPPRHPLGLWCRERWGGLGELRSWLGTDVS